MRHRGFGLFTCDEAQATTGYTLFSPIHSRCTLLLNLDGEVVHRWDHPLTSIYGYLMESGNLLWAGKLSEGPQHMGGRGGLLREYTWDGDVVWEHYHIGQHHDFRRLPNGNTVFLGWEVVPPEIERRIPGGLPNTAHLDGCMYGDFIYEIGADGRVVWEWHASRDMDVANYPISPSQRRDEFAHANAISPLANGDILISFRRLNTIGLIDRQTRKLKWEHRDDTWGMQHDCEPLANGNITLFANGCNIPTVPFSRVIEFDPRTRQTVWEYRGKPRHTFFSPHISGAQRLWTGNTLICEGQWGRVFEVTPGGDIAWEYVSPFMGPDQNGDPSNEIFRAYRYAEDSPQIQDRVRSRTPTSPSPRTRSGTPDSPRRDGRRTR
jgi:Arylsulfotransferase (ASST)